MPDVDNDSPYKRSDGGTSSLAVSACAAASTPASFSTPRSPPLTGADSLHLQSPSHSATHVTLTIADYERLMANEFGVECILKVNEEKEKALQAQIYEQMKKIEELQMTVKDLNRSAIAEQKRKIELEVQVHAQQSRVDLAVSQNSQMAEMTDSISKELAYQRAEACRLTTELDRFRTKQSTIQTEYSTLQTKFADVKTELNGLRNENTALKTELSRLKSNSAEDGTRIVDLRAENAKLKSEVERMKKENADLHKDLIDAVDRLQTAHAHLRVFGANEAKRRTETSSPCATTTPPSTTTSPTTNG